MDRYYDQDGITIYCGDCRDVLLSLDAVDHVLTDPPYARDVYRRADQRNHQSGGSVALEQLAVGAIGVMDDHLRSVIATEIARLVDRWSLVFSDAESTGDWRIALERAGLRYVRTGAWVKTDPMPQFSGDRPSVGFEPCTIVHRPDRKLRWNGGGRPALWSCGVVKGGFVNRGTRPEHPCPKPEPLMLELVALFTDPGDLILDPFMGSGTTLVAAKRLGRRAIGIDLERKYCDVAIGRLSQAALPLYAEDSPGQSDLSDIWTA